jgi:DNA-binding transcriptional regulator/RsmH inhibitor MraZ
MWDYLKALGARRVFCTTMDMVTGKIYTTAAWNQNKKVLSEAPPEKKKAAGQLLFLANAMGADAEPDDAGRMIIPMEVREKLGIRDAKIYLESTAPGVIAFYSEAIYEERKRQALEDLPAKVEYFESIGLT